MRKYVNLNTTAVYCLHSKLHILILIVFQAVLSFTSTIIIYAIHREIILSQNLILSLFKESESAVVVKIEKWLKKTLKTKKRQVFEPLDLTRFSKTCFMSYIPFMFKFSVNNNKSNENKHLITGIFDRVTLS